MMPRILVIDDDAAIAELVAINLEMAGYEVTHAEDGIKGQALAIQLLPDLIVLDLMLPRVDGFTVCQRLRRDDRTSDIPVLMLTALSQTQDKVEGFNSGADDYLTKPFHLAELSARLQSVVRRRYFGGRTEIQVRGLIIRPDARQVFVAGQPLELTRKEYDLLLFLVANPGRILTKEAIAEHLWGDNMDQADSLDIIYTHVKNLRRKINERGQTDGIKSVYGLGYKFELS